LVDRRFTARRQASADNRRLPPVLGFVMADKRKFLAPIACAVAMTVMFEA